MNYLATVMIIGLHLAITSQLNQASDVSLSEWESYKSNYGKHYGDANEDALRRQIFAHNKQRIDAFNNSPNSRNYTMGLNHLSDWTEDELRSLGGFKLPSDAESRRKFLKNSPKAEKFLYDILNDDSIQVPDKLDWRKTPGRVSKVKDQGDQCRSGWAFAAVGVLEGQETARLNKSELVELSAENLIDCIYFFGGCDGGSAADAFDHISEHGGIQDEQSYPYQGGFSECQFDENKVVLTDSGHAFVPDNDEQQLKKMLARYGPISVAINSMGMETYAGGVYYKFNCDNDGDDLNHVALLVGYGSDKKRGDYWIVKNSWSKSWGERGYIRMARNRDNNCGIASYPVIATF